MQGKVPNLFRSRFLKQEFNISENAHLNSCRELDEKTDPTLMSVEYDLSQQLVSFAYHKDCREWETAQLFLYSISYKLSVLFPSFSTLIPILLFVCFFIPVFTLSTLSPPS